MAEKASRRFHRVQNQDGAAVSTVNDWRRPAAERAAALRRSPRPFMPTAARSSPI